MGNEGLASWWASLSAEAPKTQHLNLGLLEKQQGLSNAEPSLQFLHTTKKIFKETDLPVTHSPLELPSPISLWRVNFPGLNKLLIQLKDYLKSRDKFMKKVCDQSPNDSVQR